MLSSALVWGSEGTAESSSEPDVEDLDVMKLLRVDSRLRTNGKLGQALGKPEQTTAVATPAVCSCATLRLGALRLELRQHWDADLGAYGSISLRDVYLGLVMKPNP